MVRVRALRFQTPQGELVERLADIRRRIERAGADASKVRIVAVTKGFGCDAVRSAASAGLSDIGENYAQELTRKASECGGELRWHFLGAPQRNKIARLAPLVHTWHSLDREDLAESLARLRPLARVLVQIDETGRAARRGVSADQAPALVHRCRTLGLDVVGLMAVAPPGDPAVARGCFRRLARLADELGLEERSMGMSEDFEAAVAEGATMVRLGRALFGSRPVKNSPGAALTRG